MYWISLAESAIFHFRKYILSGIINEISEFEAISQLSLQLNQVRTEPTELRVSGAALFCTDCIIILNVSNNSSNIQTLLLPINLNLMFYWKEPHYQMVGNSLYTGCSKISTQTSGNGFTGQKKQKSKRHYKAKTKRAFFTRHAPR